MAKAGFNPFASLSLWKKMQEDSNRPNLEFVSSHPSSDNRIKGLSSQLSESLELYNAVERNHVAHSKSMIPLADDNPTRSTPIITYAYCFV